MNLPHNNQVNSAHFGHSDAPPTTQVVSRLPGRFASKASKTITYEKIYLLFPMHAKGSQSQWMNRNFNNSRRSFLN